MYCENQLTLYGSMKELKKFHNENKSDNENSDELEPSILCFANSAPYPEELADDPEQSNLYNWAILNWGTKSDCCGGDVLFNWQDTDEQNTVLSPVSLENIIYTFYTEWSPPMNWVNKITKKYPEIKFELKYSDENGGISGVYLVKDSYIHLDKEGYYGEYYGNASDKDTLEDVRFAD